LSIERNRGKSDVGIKVRVCSKRVKGREERVWKWKWGEEEKG